MSGGDNFRFRRPDKDKSAQSTKVLGSKWIKRLLTKKPVYFNILAGIGDKKSLAAVSKAYNNGDACYQTGGGYRIVAMGGCKCRAGIVPDQQGNTDAALKNKALRGYVAMISKSDYPADEKIIYLRDAMEVAQTVPQKKIDTEAKRPTIKLSRRWCL